METMFDIVGVGVDWIELKRREDELIAKVTADVATKTERKTKLTAAKKALSKGLSPEDAAELADLPVDEVLALIPNN